MKDHRLHLAVRWLVGKADDMLRERMYVLRGFVLPVILSFTACVAVWEEQARYATLDGSGSSVCP